MTTPSETYKHNYATLQRIAAEMRQQDEPDIDALVPMVDEALKSYQVCKSRIAAVTEALGQRLPEDIAKV